MASSDVWLDFETLRHNIKHNTVDRLKQILSGLNEECGTHYSKSGKKQDIIDRIVATLDTWRVSNVEDKWIKAKAVVYQVRNSGIYTPTRIHANPSVPSSSTIPHNSYATAGVVKPAGYPSTSAGSSTIGRYDPYAPPRKASGAITVASTSSAPKPTGQKPGIRFKESPFFQIDQAVSPVVECPESTSATDRRQQTVTFTLNNEQITKLKSTSSKYQLRLFCTSSMFYTPTPNSFRTTSVMCPIEFPPTCEVRVNNVQLTANLKGLKKKPGTAPPPDLGKYARLTALQNRVEMVYVNSQQPVQSKKFYLVVMLVEVTSVEQLVDTLKKGKFRSSQEIRQKMVESMTEDDDIVAGPQKMSLKCPLSFMRVNTPCRSAKCVHPQCFDATSWFSVMEQTTTWLCPVCERILDSKDLIIDGYFDEILKQSPESVEDVVVEADGEWHTSDNKYSSATWKSTHPAARIIKPPSTPRKSLSFIKSPSHTPTRPASGIVAGNGKAKANDEIVVLDSDDEDEGRVKRELSPSHGSGSSVSVNRSFDGTSVPQSHTDDVIDLTLESDDEEPPVSTQPSKRKASVAGFATTSGTELIWKKGRTVDHTSTMTAIPPTTPRNANGRDYPRHPHHTHTVARPSAPSSPPIRYAPQYPGTSLPHIYSTFPPRGAPAAAAPQLPPLNSNTFLPQLNGSSNSRWS